METKLQILSDIHLELGGRIKLERHADYLALCGDIGSPKTAEYGAFLAEASQMFKWVFVIAGNHEYYNAHADMDDIDEHMMETCSLLPNVTFLQNSSHTIGNIRFVGTTLWTDTSVASHYLQASMNDYVKIKRKVRNETGYRRYSVKPEHIYALHKDAVSAIIEEVIEARRVGQQVVILTHHLPTFRNINPKYANNPINHGYATNLEYMIAPPIIAWVHGHSHYCTETVINGVPVLCNSRGYTGEDTGFIANRTVELGEGVLAEKQIVDIFANVKVPDDISLDDL